MTDFGSILGQDGYDDASDFEPEPLMRAPKLSSKVFQFDGSAAKESRRSLGKPIYPDFNLVLTHIIVPLLCPYCAIIVPLLCPYVPF